MKLVPLVTVAAMLVAACSRTEAPPSADATSSPESAAPATDQAAATGQPPAATPGAAGARATTGAAPAAAASTPAPAPAPAPPPAPKFREVTIPAGTPLSVTVLTNLGSATSAVEDAVRGALANPVVVAGVTALPSGAELTGVVTEVKKSGRVKGKASIAFRFEHLSAYGETQNVQTAGVILEAGKGTKGDVKKGGLGAGVGAVVGGIAGGGTGAAIGAVAGGAGTVLATKGDEVDVPAGTVVQVLVQQAVTVQVPIK